MVMPFKRQHPLFSVCRVSSVALIRGIATMDFDIGSCFESTPLDFYSAKKPSQPSPAKRAREAEITKETPQQPAKREKIAVTIPKAEVPEPPQTCPLPTRRSLPPLMQPLGKRKNEVDEESGGPPPVRSRGGPPPLLQGLPSISSSISSTSNGPPPLLVSNDEAVDHTRHIEVNSEPPLGTLEHKLDPIDTIDDGKSKASEAGVEGWRASDRLLPD